MSEDADEAKGGASFAELATNIVEDCLYNIIHDIVLQTHREEKVLRMQSAATIAEQAAIAEHQENASVAKGSTNQPPSVKIDTPGAAYENGRVTLHGNPLKTTPEIICPYCKLPRLMYPIAGTGMQMPDLSKTYCTRHPFVSRSGHDIYNNPFPTDMAKTKKERELIKRAEKDATPGSSQGDGGDQENSLSKLNPGGKPASYIPWHTCPNCKRSLLITRFAQHAEKCLGISGRQSSRNAMAKLNSQGGSSVAGNTPLGSRLGTPAPGNASGKISPAKRDRERERERERDRGDGDEGDEGEETPKKIKKKGSYVKKADREKADRDKEGLSKPSNPLKLKVGTGKRPPKESSSSGGGGGGGEKGEGKDDSSKRERDREGDDGDVPRKKMKLFRTESTVSEAPAKDAADQSAAAAASPTSTAS
ncbi:uncharacterized protein K452DRAFT_303284 [Aplosporella prunicola CBS 121167]|uniref:SAGA-associated factor 11 n=1 Tax=Aplosporella prunicola CBS 121167 TaxID=1176127 RepID=A0A6A6AYE2_9PEZI|nr:uncharacterized protein K452DRAFT_303284 [Aplosporella prunicola CBS 121167]KAF2135797.1 hypothetical protein K452DRAFT_303284 [Aplosporella prunicola CBS 121167]